jgi:hypothetical protein
MSQTHWWLFWAVGLVMVGAWAARSLFSKDARLERRRRKSHNRIISKEGHRTVRFGVSTRKGRKK